MQKVLSVNFEAKQVIEETKVTPEEVLYALNIMHTFLSEDYAEKESRTNTALQVWDHDLEDINLDDMDEREAMKALRKRKALKNSRRDLKMLSSLKELVCKNFSNPKQFKHVATQFGARLEKLNRGSCDVYFSNLLKRKGFISENHSLFKSARIKGEE